MRFGFSLPLVGDLSRPEILVRLAREGEALGYDYLTFSDHVVIPTEIEARYPYSDTGEFPQGARGGRHEQLTALTFIAGATQRIRLVTSVMVVPHRPAVLTAKILSTIDVLSGGRLTLGIGAGWLREEFEAIGTPPFAERGAVTDEYLDAFCELWTADAPRFEGRYTRFADIVFEPKPVQRPHPPIWIGGESGPALRRTARIGDGWYPIGTNPQHPLDTLPRYRAAVARLRRLTEEAGRDPAAVALAYRVQKYGEEVAPADDGSRRLLAGSAAAMAEDVRALAEAGVGFVDVSFPGATVDAVLDAMRWFHAEVVARG